MRLYRFGHQALVGILDLPVYKATSVPVLHTVEIDISRTTTGYVVNKNVAPKRRLPVLSHTGSYFFPDTETAYDFIRLGLDPMVGFDDYLFRGYTEYGNGIGFAAANVVEKQHIKAILRSVQLVTDVQYIHSASKYEMKTNFQFQLLETEWTEGEPS